MRGDKGGEEGRRGKERRREYKVGGGSWGGNTVGQIGEACGGRKEEKRRGGKRKRYERSGVG